MLSALLLLPGADPQRRIRKQQQDTDFTSKVEHVFAADFP